MIFLLFVIALVLVMYCIGFFYGYSVASAAYREVFKRKLAKHGITEEDE